MVTVNDMNRD